MRQIRDHKDHPVTRSLTIIDPTRAAHGTATRYRYGCHCADCRTAHGDDAKQRRRASTFTDQTATAILTLLSGGGTIRDVELATRVSWQAIAGRASWDDQWRTAWDAALMAGRNPDLAHGTFTAYTRDRCRCPECRASRRPKT